MAGDAREAKGSTWVVLQEVVSGERPGIRVLLPVIVLECGAYAMVMPVMAFFEMQELGLSAWEVGLTLSARAAAQVVGGCFTGRVSDAVGRRPILVALVAWSGLGLGATAFVTTFLQLVLLRASIGLSGGTSVIFNTYTLDLAPARLRAAYIGLLGCISGISFVIGPALAMLLLFFKVGRRTIFLVAGAVALSAAALGLCLLPESLQPAKRRPLCGSQDQGSRATASDWSIVSGGLVCIWCASFALAMAHGFLFVTYAFLISDLFGWTDFHMGMVMLVASVGSAVLNLVGFPCLVAMIGAPWVLTFGAVSGAVSFALFPIRSFAVHVVALFFLVLCFATSGTVIPVLIGDYVGDTHLGFANGVCKSVSSVASVGAPLLGGVLYNLGPRYAFYTGAGIQLLVAALGAALAVCSCFPAAPEERRPLKPGAV